MYQIISRVLIVRFVVICILESLQGQRKLCTLFNMKGREKDMKVHPRSSKTNSFVTICIRKGTLITLLNK